MSDTTTILNNVLTRRTSRRKLLAEAGATAGAVALGTGLIGTGGRRGAADASTLVGTYGIKPNKFTINDFDILNFALNLEYLEAEFYQRAAFGIGIPDADVTGVLGYGTAKAAATQTTPGTVTGGSPVPFQSPVVQAYAQEIATDELSHVRFLRIALGAKAVARPTINFTATFTALAQAAGVVDSSTQFNPFADDNSFLVGAFIFEDVGVTAYGGAAPYVKNAAYLQAAAGILAVEGYHASSIRSILAQRSIVEPTIATNVNKISALRSAASVAASGGAADDVGIGTVNADGSFSNVTIVPATSAGMTYVRGFPSVLNIVYLNTTATPTPGGFFPSGMNGRIR